MFDYNHYVPLLKAKDGEFGALSELPLAIKSNITPFIDVYNSKSKLTLEARLAKIANKIETSWGCARPIFVDLFGIDLKERVSQKKHPITFIFNQLRELNIKAIPSTGFDRDEAYNESIENIAMIDNRGVCIRLLIDDMENTDELQGNLESMLSNLGLSYADTHLSRELVNMAEFYGESFCWGDNYISSCAQETNGPGNMTTWRKVGINHHITLVSTQIANSVVL